MATIRKEFRSPRPASDVWGVLKRFEAVHDLAKGFVTKTDNRAPLHGVYPRSIRW